MTSFGDQINQGLAFYGRYARWNQANPSLSGLPTATAPYDTQTLGTPHTQTFVYQVGTASTALASGVFYSASGTATIAASTFTPTGPLVSAGVATFDVPRGIRITASVDLSTTTFTFVGTDGYGSVQNSAFVGPTGNTIGNTGSYVDSLTTFKTITAITGNATGVGTTTFLIGDNNMFGLPYVLTNTGYGMDAYINGSSATVPAVWVAAFTPTGSTTASTPDVRGSVTLATVVLADGTRRISFAMISPQVALTPATDDRNHSFGAAPFGGN